MTKPMSLAAFTRLSPVIRAQAVEGLSAAIDTVAQAAPESHRHLDYAWFAAALAASGGQARTIMVESDGMAVIALPVIGVGPEAAGLVMVPGPKMPGRGFPAVAEIADAAACAALVERLGEIANGLRIGPVAADDGFVLALIEEARAKGWAVLAHPAEEETGEDDAFWCALERNRTSGDSSGELHAVTGEPRCEWLLLRPGIPALFGRLLLRVWHPARG
jgi:hypothetical protein